MDDVSFSEVADGIYTCDHAVVEGKNVVIFGQRAAAAVDTGIEPADGKRLVRLIEGRGFEARRLVLTHGHADHVFGSGAFRGADVYTGVLCADVMREQIPRWKERYGTDPADCRQGWAWPSVTFTDRMFIDLGDVTLDLFPVPGHSRDSICVYVPERRLLVGGDTVVRAIVPAVFHDGRQLVGSLQRIAGLDVEVLVPGHGEVLGGRRSIQSWIMRLVEYLSTVRERIRKAVAAGMAEADIPEAVPADELLPAELDRAKYGMERRHRMVVDKLMAEETAVRNGRGGGEPAC